MLGNSKPASFYAGKVLNFIILSTFALWVSEVEASSSGGGAGGSSGGSSGGSGGSAGGGNDGNSGGGDRGGRDANFDQRAPGYVARNRIDEIVAPTGFVISDDICTGGKFEKC